MRNDCKILSPSEFTSSLLHQLTPLPPVLYAKGNTELLRQEALAIVGTRRPSNYGVRTALHFSKQLAESGFCIVSGLARGIDSAAHKGALQAQGATIAVLGHGLDRIYPSENRSLAESILAAGGCLISEYPLGTPPMKHHFPQRNRIISGLAFGTLVIEASEKSGSLITASFARDQNREVFVVPGFFDDEGFSGSHQLIQQGAKLVRNIDDIWIEIANTIPSKPTTRLERELVQLRSSLKEVGGVATLQELFAEVSWSLPELIEKLQRGIQLGCVQEISAQKYAWMGD